MADVQLQTSSTAKNVWKAVKPYVLGGVSGMFATVRFSLRKFIALLRQRTILSEKDGF
jgi:hypothetical protein